MINDLYLLTSVASIAESQLIHINKYGAWNLLFQTQIIYGGHMSFAAICRRHVSSIDFVAMQTKNNGPF